MIAVIDYGMGNVGSITNMLRKLGLPSIITHQHDEIKKASALILPGVGAFDNGVLGLKKRGIISLLEEKVLMQKTPLLGICLGMQLLLEKSEEGDLPGLGWISGDVTRFHFNSALSSSLKIPHMGWNTINITKPAKLTIVKKNEPNRYYFVHSYHVNCSNEYVLATTNYGYEFPCAIHKDNIWGAQFHPEKSHCFGFSFFCDFLREAMCLEHE